ATLYTHFTFLICFFFFAISPTPAENLEEQSNTRLITARPLPWFPIRKFYEAGMIVPPTWVEQKPPYENHVKKIEE
ncbi:MAG TPA: hypothetical protein PKG48_09850, partial [Bacteroidales bacterium]|nr:hypothetical protein [Bacteroidales bacterium]